MKKNFLNHINPMNLDFMKYNNNRINIEKQKILYSRYIQENMKKRQNLRNLQNNNRNFLNNEINNRLTEYEPKCIKSTNILFFENSNNKINDKYLRKEKYNKSIKIPKDRRLLSSENIFSGNNNPELTVLINNGIIKNMYINKDLKDYYKNNYSKNNNIYNKENVFKLNLQNPKLFNYYYNITANNESDSFSNLTKINFRDNNILNKTIKNNINKEKQIDYYNNKNRKKELIKKYIYNRNKQVDNNLNIENINNKIRNQNYIIKNNLIIKNNNPNNKKLTPNNNKSKTTKFYTGTNIYNNNDVENISFFPLPFQYKRKQSFGPNKVNNINLKYNLMNENQNSNKIFNKKINNKKNYNYYNKNNNELITSSSEELSLLADEIITKFHKKNNRINTPILGNNNKNNKRNDSYSKFIGVEQINNTEKINTSADIIDINKIKKGKKKLLIPMNSNNFMISSNNNMKSIDKNNVNSKDIENDLEGNKKIFYGISQKDKSIHKNKSNKQEKNTNNILIPNNNENIITQKIRNNLEDEKKLNNFERAEENIKTSELNDEDYLIEEIMNKAQNEENNKKNRHVDFNIENNIYINFNSKDLITNKIVIKGNKMLEINNNNEKKMDIYFTLLKSKTKFNPIIKKYDKNEIKINKEYELNENLEEYEILGDLYNIFYMKNINDLDNKLKNTIDNFMKDKK